MNQVPPRHQVQVLENPSSRFTLDSFWETGSGDDVDHNNHNDNKERKEEEVVSSMVHDHHDDNNNNNNKQPYVFCGDMMMMNHHEMAQHGVAPMHMSKGGMIM